MKKQHFPSFDPLPDLLGETHEANTNRWRAGGVCCSCRPS